MDGRMGDLDGWRQTDDIEGLDVAVKTTLEIHTDTNSWRLTGVSTCPASYLFIGHFMRDCHDAAKFGAQTDK